MPLWADRDYLFEDSKKDRNSRQKPGVRMDLMNQLKWEAFLTYTQGHSACPEKIKYA